MNKLGIRKSRIAGKGVFAESEIARGDFIAFLIGERCSLDEVLKRVIEGKENPSDPLQIDDEQYLDLEETSRTFNHSCDPNAFIRNENELVALRDISVGEEVVYDYSTTMNDNERKIKDAGRALWTCVCCCGSETCRRTIDQFKTLPKDVQQYYLSYGYLPRFMLKEFKK